MNNVALTRVNVRNDAVEEYKNVKYLHKISH